MNNSKIRPLTQTAAKDNRKTNAAKSNVSREIRKRLIYLANAIKDNAFDQIDSSLLILKFKNELEILRLKNEIGGRL